MVARGQHQVSTRSKARDIRGRRREGSSSETMRQSFHRRKLHASDQRTLENIARAHEALICARILLLYELGSDKANVIETDVSGDD